LGHGRYRLWAAVASVVFHVVVLSVLAAARLYPESTPLTANQSEQARLARVRSITQSCPLVPKPNIKHGIDAHFIPRKPNLPIQGEAPASKVRAADNEPILLTSSSYTDIAWSQQDSAPQEVKFFSSGARCKRLCYLVDCSGSMKGLLGQVKDELSRSILALRPDQYFGIIFFGDDKVTQLAAGRLVRASRQSKAEALAYVKSIDAAGQTNALAGFAGAVRLRNDDGAGPEVILFLTDGFELSTGDVYRFRQNIINLRQTYLAGCIINTIGFWPSESDRRLLESIAALSGGQFVGINEAGYKGGSRDYEEK